MLLNGILLAGGILYTSIQAYKHRQQPEKKDHYRSAPPEVSKRKSRQLPDNIIQETDIATVEEWADRYFTISTAALGLAVAGIWIPPFAIISTITLTLLTIPIWKRACQGLVKQHRLKADAISLIVFPLLIVSGYLPAAAFGYWLYYLGLKFLAKAKKKSATQLTHIFNDQRSSVWIQKDDYEIEIGISELQLHDIVVVQAGGAIPVDGVIVNGMAAVDQRIMTGESQPAEKESGDSVLACTIVLSGKIWVKAEKTGQETSAAQIEQILTNSTDFAALAELRAEKMSDRLALPTLALGALALPIAGYVGALVVLDSPLVDNLCITGTLSVLSHLSVASRHNLLIKDGRALERLRQVNTVVFDKTGTLTQDQPRVGKIYQCCNNRYTEKDILIYAAAAEYKQTHPIAKAVQREVEEQQLSIPVIDESRYEIGYGVKVRSDIGMIRVGSAKFMVSENIFVPDEIKNIQKKSHQQGFSLLYVAVDNLLAGVIELHPCIRPEAKMVIQELKRRRLSLYIISGDHEEPTKALARQLGIEHYFAETLPENKADLIEQLQRQGRSVCFVGDGINDAVALKKTDVSVSLGGASTIAIDTAQIILMDSNLDKLIKLFDLSENLEENFKKSVLWDVVPNAVCIGGAFFFHLGIYGALAIYAAGLTGGVINGAWAFAARDRENNQ